ncbi:MAG: ABC transporter permease [Luteolibacter sp.]|jgi:putative ABC transport system permease protein|nr:ABC transporter permease [Luteolibacter sp.]
MLHHYFIVALRNLWKHKTFSAINILGLALAMTACVFIFIHVRMETQYDTFWGNSPRLFRIVHDRYQNGVLNLKSAKACYGMGRILQEKLPQVEAGTEIFRDIASVATDERHIQDISMFAAEDSLFEVLQFPFVVKKSDHPLAGIHSAVLSESATIKLFGTAQALGKWFRVNEGWEFEVTGVFKDFPANSHLGFDLLISRKTYDYYAARKEGVGGRAVARDEERLRATKRVTDWSFGGQGHYAYLLLRPGSDPRHVEEQINRIKKDYLKNVTKDGTRIDFFLQPVRDIHLHSNRIGEDKTNGDYRAVVATAVLGCVILCIAWINFINLSLARSLERAKEVAIRKVAGASRRELVAQYFVEYGIINFLSAMLTLVLVVVFDPAVSGLMGRELAAASVLRDPVFLGGAAVVWVLGIILAGSYPALIQSSYDSMMLFKPKHQFTAHRLDPRKILVVFQFAVSIGLTVGVITIYRQLDFMRGQALGVDIGRTLVTYSSMRDLGSPKRIASLQTYKDKVRALPGVEAVTTSSSMPGSEIIWQQQDVRKDGDPPHTKNNCSYAYVDHDFIPAFQLTMRAGRNFSANTAAEATTVIVNEKAARKFGFADAGQAVDSILWVGGKQYRIVGVVNDYHQESLRKEIRPVIFFCGYKWVYEVGYYAIKVRSGDIRATIADIRRAWRQIYPMEDFDYRFLDETFDQQYRGDRQFGVLFTLFTLLAVFIACLGLYGLATHSISKRTKEIGIRKVNGATTRQIVSMLAGEFTRWVAVAFVIACPAVYLVMEDWLENYAYRISLTWPTFVVAGLLALGIAIVTTLFQAWRAATRNPVDALRYE